jgi:hypothetical protein
LRDLYLDSDGDIELSNGDLRTVEGNDSIQQAIGLALSLFKGEWFLDGDLGVPFYEDVLVKSPNLNAIREIFRQKLTSVSGVNEIAQLDLSFDRSSRTLSLTWKVTTDTGELSGSFLA